MSTAKRSEAVQEVLATESLRAAAMAPPAVPSLASDGDAAQVMAIIAHAVERGLDVQAMSTLVDLQERIANRGAALEFSRALVRFQHRCPAVAKNHTGGKVEGGGTGFKFAYADYEDIATVIGPHLAAEGFSYTFDTEATVAMLKVTCTLRHELGHTSSSSFSVPTESKAPVSAQQKYGGARTYAKRMTLIDVLGLTLTDPESPEEAAASQPLSDEHSATLEALFAEVCADAAVSAAFFKFMRVGSLSDITEGRYGEAVRALEKKRGGAK